MCRLRGRMGKHAKGERPKKFNPKKDLPPPEKGRERVFLRDEKKLPKKEAKRREEIRKEALRRAIEEG